MSIVHGVDRARAHDVVLEALRSAGEPVRAQEVARRLASAGLSELEVADAILRLLDEGRIEATASRELRATRA